MADTTEERLTALEQQVTILTSELASTRRVLLNAQRESVPIGSIEAFAGHISDSTRKRLSDKGWLLCNGDPYNGQQWPELFSVIEKFWGTGNGGEKEFSVPNLEGLFLRGVTTDPKKAEVNDRQPLGTGTPLQVGSIQRDAFKDHVHDYIRYVYEQTPNPPHIPEGDPMSYDPVERPTSGAKEGSSTETRPRNAYVHYIIKAGRYVPQD